MQLPSSRAVWIPLEAGLGFGLLAVGPWYSLQGSALLRPVDLEIAELGRGQEELGELSCGSSVNQAPPSPGLISARRGH